MGNFSLSKKNRTVVNVSTSGANIDDIRLMAKDFHEDNLRSIHKIDSKLNKEASDEKRGVSLRTSSYQGGFSGIRNHTVN